LLWNGFCHRGLIGRDPRGKPAKTTCYAKLDQDGPGIHYEPHPDGEAGAARASGAAGTAYMLSTISGHRVEDVTAASAGPVCFQLYMLGGQEAGLTAAEQFYALAA
jgi:hypothetical protein